jgi:methyltransferase-like protein/2-polyprenyl-3-methyl-5-hydroxy-6-metoxy-1,4-benzoquinol methylase
LSTTAYDQVAYPGFAYAQAHHDRLATIGRLYGLRTAPVSSCRVLELGCGDGANLLPAALAFPGSEFVGIDVAATAVATGQALARDLDVHNLDLRHGDIEALPDELGRFDYIVAHGIYSWVPPSTRSALLAACSRFMNPHGVAYVSYNAYPGSHVRDMAGEIFEFHLEGVSDPDDRVRRARALMQLVIDADVQSGYAEALRSHFRWLLEKDDYLLLHDDLAEVNTPVYFHEFASHAAAHGLQFLSEAEAAESRLEGVREDLREQIKTISADQVVLEQYLDFMKNRMFRRTLVCHADRTLDRNPSPSLIDDLAISCPAIPQSRTPELRRGETEEFTTLSGGTIGSDESFVKAGLLALAERWPGALRFPELVERANQLLARAQLPPSIGRERDAFRSLALGAYFAGLLQLWTEPPPTRRMLTDRPVASKLARLQIERGAPVVTSLVHDNVAIDDPLERRLIVLLDGTRDLEALAGEVEAEVPVGDVRASVHIKVDRLGALGLLEDEPAHG